MSAPANGKVAGNSPIFDHAPLPVACPPDDAAGLAKQVVLRLVPSDPPTPNDFFPSAVLPGRHRPDWCDECRWHSCSMYLASKETLIRLRDMTKLKNLRHMKFIAHVEVDEESGVAKPWPNDPGHISYWAISPFSPAASIKKCEPV